MSVPSNSAGPDIALQQIYHWVTTCDLDVQKEKASHEELRLSLHKALFNKPVCVKRHSCTRAHSTELKDLEPCLLLHLGMKLAQLGCKESSLFHVGCQHHNTHMQLKPRPYRRWPLQWPCRHHRCLTCISYKRLTPVVVSSDTPTRFLASLLHF